MGYEHVPVCGEKVMSQWPSYFLTFIIMYNASRKYSHCLNFSTFCGKGGGILYTMSMIAMVLSCWHQENQQLIYSLVKYCTYGNQQSALVASDQYVHYSRYILSMSNIRSMCAFAMQPTKETFKYF